MGSLDSRRPRLQFRRYLAGKQSAQGFGKQGIQLDRHQKSNGIQEQDEESDCAILPLFLGFLRVEAEYEYTKMGEVLLDYEIIEK